MAKDKRLEISSDGPGLRAGPFMWPGGALDGRFTGLPGLGTVVNVTTVVVGSLLGLAIGGRMPGRLNDHHASRRRVTVLIGVQMALEASEGRFVALLVSVSAIVGELPISKDGSAPRQTPRTALRRDETPGGSPRASSDFSFAWGPDHSQFHPRRAFGGATLLMTKSVLDGIGDRLLRLPRSGRAALGRDGIHRAKQPDPFSPASARG